MVFKFQLKAMRIRYFGEKHFFSVSLRDLRASVVNKTHITSKSTPIAKSISKTAPTTIR